MFERACTAAFTVGTLNATSIPKFLGVTIDQCRQGSFLRTAYHRSDFQSLQQMSRTRLTYLQMVGLEERPTQSYKYTDICNTSHYARDSLKGPFSRRSSS